MSDFILYSYQCHPIHIEVNAKKPSIDPVYDQQCNREADEAMAKHQELFEKLFNTPEIHNFKKDDNLFFLHKGNYYGGKIVMNRGGVIMLRLQKSKFKEYELDYKIVTLKEEPSSLIIIDNRFEQQRILIERNRNTFQPKTIAALLEKNIGAQLAKDRVGIEIPLVYRKELFWNFVENHERGIKKIIFDFPYPNMARPMDKLGASLKKFGVDIRGKVRVEATAQRNDILFIEPKEKNEDLDDIVSYLSDIGAPVNIHLVNGRRVKCFSDKNPIVIDVKKSITEFRGDDDQNQLFNDRIFNAVTELLNSLKEINYPQDSGNDYI
jgi:hypothetical protein